VDAKNAVGFERVVVQAAAAMKMMAR